jgi:hypothetical protein
MTTQLGSQTILIRAPPDAKVRTAMSNQMPQCPKCGMQNISDARFCERCGTKLSGKVSPTAQSVRPSPEAKPVQAAEPSQPAGYSIPHVEETSEIPLYSIPVKLSDESLRAEGEKAKAALFGLAGKRTLVGKKPEEYVILESMAWADHVYIRVHGVYTSTYVVHRVFPLAVGEETIEVEVEGPNLLIPEKGTLNLRTHLRKTYRQEATTYYDERGEEVQVELPPKSELKHQRTVHEPLTVEHVLKLLDTTLEWAKRHLTANMTKLTAEGATVEKEKLDLSDHEVILVPYCVLTYVDTKTKEKKSLTFDSLTGKLLPSTVAQRHR